MDAGPTCDQVAGLTLARLTNSFVETDHKIFSMVILSQLLIQEEQLSISGERMCTIVTG